MALIPIVHLRHLVRVTGEGKKWRGAVDGRSKQRGGSCVLLIVVLNGIVGAQQVE